MRNLWTMFFVAFLTFFFLFYALVPLQTGGLIGYVLFQDIQGPEQESKNFFRLVVLIIPCLSAFAAIIGIRLSLRIGWLTRLNLALATAVLAVCTLALVLAQLLEWRIFVLVALEATMLIWLVLLLNLLCSGYWGSGRSEE